MCRKSLLRENIHNLDRKRKKCSLQSAMILTFAILGCLLYSATNLVQWDTNVTFTMPTSDDLKRPAGATISQSILHSPEWRERKLHIIAALESGCAYNSFSVTTHKSLRVMNKYVDEGVLYICSTKRAYVNMKITPSSNAHILCRESYGKATREVRRGKFKFSAFDLTSMVHVEDTIQSPDLICSLGHGFDLVQSNWHI